MIRSILIKEYYCITGDDDSEILKTEDINDDDIGEQDEQNNDILVTSKYYWLINWYTYHLDYILGN